MKLRSIISCVVALFIIVGSASAALAGGDLPGPIAAELTQYPGSTLLNGHSLPGGNHIANMNFGNASVSDVYNYYKAKMIANGFTIQTEVQGTTIVGNKGDMNAMVDLESRNGATVGTLSITGGSGGQAVTNAPATPAQPTVPTTPPAAPSSSAGAGSGPEKLSIGSPGSQAKYHPEIAGVVKQYPGSTVMTSMENAREFNALLSMQSGSAADAAAFYKAEVPRKGWKKTEEMNMSGNMMIEFKKGGQEFMVVIRDVGGPLIITLALKK